MFGDDNRAAGRTNESRQHKEPNVRVSNTFKDSDIFGVRNPPQSTTPVPEHTRRKSEVNVYTEPQRQMRISKTFQDSNIFGTKDLSSSLITETTKKEMQRPFTAHKKVITRPTEINQVFTNDDKVARNKLRRMQTQPFTPSYEKSSPTKRHINEFYGEHHGEGYDGTLLRPQSATLSKSFGVSPKSASDTKWQHQQSNIFLDDTKPDLMRQLSDTNQDRLMSAKSSWSSKDAHKKSSNLRKSEDLSNTQLTAFAQNKKKTEMNSDIFNANPRREERSHTEACSTPVASNKIGFTDTNNQDLRRSQHMFSDLFGHEGKNYTYNNAHNMEPVRPTNLAWSDSRTEKLSPKKIDEQSATERKRAHLASSTTSVMQITDHKSPKDQDALKVTHKALEKEMIPQMSPQQKKTHEMRSELPFGENSQSWTGKKASNDSLATYDLDLKSIPSNMSLEALKKTFAGYHVINLQADRNPVSGSDLGNGRVQLRASTQHDILKLKHDLKEKGIEIATHEENHNKKNKNYRDLAKVDWHDQYLQGEEGRLKSEFTNAFESKLKNLESEGDIFGNSQGVGKWDRNSLEKVPTSKTDNGGEQKAAIDVVKTLNWKNTVKKVTNTAKAGAQDGDKPKTTKTTKVPTSTRTSQARKAK